MSSPSPGAYSLALDDLAVAWPLAAVAPELARQLVAVVVLGAALRVAERVVRGGDALERRVRAAVLVRVVDPARAPIALLELALGCSKSVPRQVGGDSSSAAGGNYGCARPTRLEKWSDVMW